MYSDLDIRRPRLFLTNAIIPLLILFNVYMHFSMQEESAQRDMLIMHIVSFLFVLGLYAPITFYWVFRLLGIGLLFIAATTGKEDIPGMLWIGFWGVMFLFTPKYAMRNDYNKSTLFYKTDLFDVDLSLSPTDRRLRAGHMLTSWIYENLPKSFFNLQEPFINKKGWVLTLSRGEVVEKIIVNADYIGKSGDEFAFSLSVGIEDIFLRNMLKDKEEANRRAAFLLEHIKPIFLNALFTEISIRDFASAEGPIIIKKV